MQEDKEKIIKQLCDGLYKFFEKHGVETRELKYFKSELSESSIVDKFIITYSTPEIIVKDMNLVDAYMEYCVYGQINGAKKTAVRKHFLDLLNDQVPFTVDFDKKLYEKNYENPKQNYSDDDLITM